MSAIFNIENTATCTSAEWGKWSIKEMEAEIAAIKRNADNGFMLDEDAIAEIEQELERRNDL